MKREIKRWPISKCRTEYTLRLASKEKRARVKVYDWISVMETEPMTREAAIQIVKELQENDKEFQYRIWK